MCACLNHIQADCCVFPLESPFFCLICLVLGHVGLMMPQFRTRRGVAFIWICGQFEPCAIIPGGLQHEGFTTFARVLGDSKYMGIFSLSACAIAAEVS